MDDIDTEAYIGRELHEGQKFPHGWKQKQFTNFVHRWGWERDAKLTFKLKSSNSRNLKYNCTTDQCCANFTVVKSLKGKFRKPENPLKGSDPMAPPAYLTACWKISQITTTHSEHCSGAKKAPFTIWNQVVEQASDLGRKISEKREFLKEKQVTYSTEAAMKQHIYRRERKGDKPGKKTKEGGRSKGASSSNAIDGPVTTVYGNSGTLPQKKRKTRGPAPSLEVDDSDVADLTTTTTKSGEEVGQVIIVMGRVLDEDEDEEREEEVSGNGSGSSSGVEGRQKHKEMPPSTKMALKKGKR
jgi:hypothetical protein